MSSSSTAFVSLSSGTHRRWWVFVSFSRRFDRRPPRFAAPAGCPPRDGSAAGRRVRRGGHLSSSRSRPSRPSPGPSTTRPGCSRPRPPSAAPGSFSALVAGRRRAPASRSPSSSAPPGRTRRTGSSGPAARSRPPAACTRAAGTVRRTRAAASSVVDVAAPALAPLPAPAQLGVEGVQDLAVHPARR
jgi:hypothetical protein